MNTKSNEIIKKNTVWVALQVYNGSELSVKNRIDQRINDDMVFGQILETLAPYENYISIGEKTLKKTILKKAVYPGYIYLNLIKNYNMALVWQSISNIPKISKFIGDKNTPTPMTEKDIEKIKKLDILKENEPKYKVSFKTGQKVLIKSGPWENFKGVIKSHNTQKRTVSVEINIFNQAQEIKDLSQSIISLVND